MGEATKIEWTDHTWNPWRGCTKVSPGCDHCYAEALSGRNPAVLGDWGPDGRRVIAAEDYWQLPFKWDRAAAKAGVRRRVFSLSLGDWLEDRPELDEPLGRFLHTIAYTPSLDYLLLTKRPGNFCRRLLAASNAVDDCYHPSRRAVDWIGRWLGGHAPPNVWLGVSVEDQARADGRIPRLLEIPAAVRFLSCEPLLGPVDLNRLRVPGGIWDALYGWKPFQGPEGANTACLDWVIVGGESGPGARPMHPGWARSIRDQCVTAGVPFFMKQMTKKAPIPDDLFIREFPSVKAI